MATINLKDFYYWYTQDEYIEISDEVAAELTADKRYEKIHKQRVRRNKSFYSLDVDDGIEASATVHSTDNPVAVLEKKEQFCRLCRAINSLPETQGRRVEAYFMLRKSRKEIAEAEGVSESAVNESIDRGLKAMKKVFSNNFENCPVKCP
jgi:RNA polymerase sigma-70 factor (ECF subfamily)